MGEANTCKLCRKRRPKRACPAVNGDICPICCGEQREITLACPMDCVFLREAHKHERVMEVPLGEISYADVEISERFIREHEELLLFCVYALVQGALRTPHAVDTDVLEALRALIQTKRTAQSGLVYESRPDNPVAAGVQMKFSESMDGYEKERQEREGFAAYKEGDIFKMLVFLHRIGQQNSNGRPKGRMFIDMLREMTPDTRVDERAPSIIL